jgi:hypothetical protein
MEIGAAAFAVSDSLGWNLVTYVPGAAKRSIRWQNGAPHRDIRAIFLDEMHHLQPHCQWQDRTEPGGLEPPRRRL